MDSSEPLGAPGPVYLTPNSGTGLTQTFTMVYSDPMGLSALSEVLLLFNTTLTSSDGCNVEYYPATNLIYLLNTAGTGLSSKGVTPGTATSVSNSACTVNGTGSSVSTSGDTLHAECRADFRLDFRWQEERVSGG